MIEKIAADLQDLILNAIEGPAFNGTAIAEVNMDKPVWDDDMGESVYFDIQGKDGRTYQVFVR